MLYFIAIALQSQKRHHAFPSSTLSLDYIVIFKQISATSRLESVRDEVVAREPALL